MDHVRSVDEYLVEWRVLSGKGDNHFFLKFLPPPPQKKPQVAIIVTVTMVKTMVTIYSCNNEKLQYMYNTIFESSETIVAVSMVRDIYSSNYENFLKATYIIVHVLYQKLWNCIV